MNYKYSFVIPYVCAARAITEAALADPPSLFDDNASSEKVTD